MNEADEDLMAEYESRVLRWGEDYEYGDPSVLAAAVEQGGSLLEQLTSPEVANEAMKVVWLALAGKVYSNAEEELESHENWRDLFEEFSIETGIAEYSLGQTLVRLSYYADEGILAPGETDMNIVDSTQWIRDQIDMASSVYCLLPRSFGDASLLERLIEKSEARLALDTGKPLTLTGLASLAGVAVKSVRNALAPGSAENLETTDEGLITNETAQAWLSRRDSFRSSLWKEMAGMIVAPLPEPDKEDEYVFVPESKDGTYFRPSDRMTKGWKIGTKDHGYFVDDYWDALAQLTRMNTPRWRRPSKTSGIPGVVSSVRFRRVLRSDVEKELRAHGKEF